MQSKAKTVNQYLKELPADRKAELSKVLAVIRKNLPKGLTEQMSSGMIGYVVPHKLYPPGYHCDPKQALPFAGLAAQKNYMSLYMMTVYGDPRMQKWLREQFDARGKRLDMGKSCIRFRKADDLPLDVIGEAIGRVSVADYITFCEDAAKASTNRKK